MSRVINGSVAERKANRVPALSDLGVNVSSDIKVGVDPLQNSSVDHASIQIRLERVVEHDFQVAIVAVVLGEVVRAASTVENDVLKGELSRLVTINGSEVSSHRRNTRCIHPCFPVNLGEDSVDVSAT